MLSERLLKEVLTRRTTFLLALTLSSCVLRNGECASLRDVLEEKHAEAMGKAVGYINQQQMPDKDEKRSKAMGEAVRFLTDMDRSYLGQVRPRCSALFLQTSSLTVIVICKDQPDSGKECPWVNLL